MTARRHPLLEPGALFDGALFRDLLRSGEIQLQAGQRLGVFKLVRELGRGGMGVVWLAERDDGEYRQQVAIKCVTDRRSERGAELFRKERQILAELRHPNIARLLDGGRRDDGLLWFAMELIDGVAIDRHARDGALPLDARLRLFAAALDAVSVAHARLIIHRDIKPGNVLVDADGRAKLLDFGIAALADDGSAAQAYSPGWASPEQLAGAAVGTASDQYQLGLLLHAMLCSAPGSRDPADAVGSGPASDWIAMPDYRRQELQTVLARACASDPEQRFQSVAEFGREIERMLEQRPIASLRRGLRYPLACAVRRRPGVFAASTLVVLLLVVLIGGFTWRLARERDSSRLQAARAEATKDFLISLFRDGDPTRGSDPNLSARELIQAGALRVETDSALPGDARQDLMQLLADVQLHLGDGEHAAALIGRLDRATLDPARLAELEGRLADLRGEPKEAVARFAAALALGDTPQRQLLLARAENNAGEAGKSATRLQALIEASAGLSDGLATGVWVESGVRHWRNGEPRQALADYDRALERAAQAHPPVSPVPMLINKGLALNDLGRFDEALAEYARAESELARFPSIKHQGLILQNRGMALYRRGDVGKAQEVWSDLLARVDDGVNPGLEASTVHNLASTADSLGDPVASIAYSLRARALREKLGDAPSALSSHINILAKLYSLGLAERGVPLAAAAAERAQQLQRPDLEARARLAGATSGCVLEPRRCVALFEDCAARFARQDNQVKLLETLEKTAAFAFEQHDQQALKHAADAFAAALGAAPDSALSARLQLLRALQARDPATLNSLAEDSETARRALVLLALEQGDARLARRELERLPQESSDRYWLLRERVALAVADPIDAARARAARAQLRDQVVALLDRV